MEKTKTKYDFLIVGAGLFGCVCAKELTDRGYKTIVIDKRNHIGGNCAVKNANEKTEHMYGPHIFHTSNKMLWDYINEIEPLLPYRHRVVAVNGGLQYDFPINRHTLIKVLGENYDLPQRRNTQPLNFEEAALSAVGETLYHMFYYNYTAKQWGCEPSKLPAKVFSRVPVRMDYGDEYFEDKYTGVLNGNGLFDKLLKGSALKLNCAYSDKKHRKIARIIIYTGMIDEFYNYRFGKLPYRSLKFEKKVIDPVDRQGTAVVNYTDTRPYTRTCEYSYMYGNGNNSNTRWYEYPMGETDEKGKKTEPYYPKPTAESEELYEKYIEYAEKQNSRTAVYFGGRLGAYKYINMDETVKQALSLIELICATENL